MTPFSLPADWIERVRSWWPDDVGGTKRFRDLVASPGFRRAFPGFYGEFFYCQLSDLASVDVGAEPNEKEQKKLYWLERNRPVLDVRIADGATQLEAATREDQLLVRSHRNRSTALIAVRLWFPIKVRNTWMMGVVMNNGTRQQIERALATGEVPELVEVGKK